MAKVFVDGEILFIELSAVEKLESIHGEIHVPISSIRSIEVVEDALSAVHGLRSPGTGVPGLIAVGTYRGRAGSMFAVVHHDTPRGIRIRLEGADFDELLIGVADPEELVASLNRSIT
ncbi:MAG: hypothetical protein ACYDHP_03620 [Ferrimicrobium sp.]